MTVARGSDSGPRPFTSGVFDHRMIIVTGLLGFACLVLLMAIPVLAVRRMRRTTQTMQQIPDDLRRADDGGGPNSAGGPGLGPMWPTN
jgi:hypothetical protein